MSKSAANSRFGKDRTDLYSEITDKIIAELAAGRAPWVQPWGSAAGMAPLGMPKNAATDRRYTGINVLILWGAVIEHGFTGQSWLTFRQALSLGAHVRKGERGTTVVYADRFTPEDERRKASETGDEARSIAFLKRFTVFNVAQCDGLPEELITAASPEPRSFWLVRLEELRIRGTHRRNFSGLSLRLARDHADGPPRRLYWLLGRNFARRF